jgi:hypothetical protein
MQQAAFKVCRVACREVCPPGAIGVYRADCFETLYPPLHRLLRFCGRNARIYTILKTKILSG